MCLTTSFSASYALKPVITFMFHFTKRDVSFAIQAYRTSLCLWMITYHPSSCADRRLRKDSFNLLDNRSIQLHARCSRILFYLLGTTRPYKCTGHIVLTQNPGQGQLANLQIQLVRHFNQLTNFPDAIRIDFSFVPAQLGSTAVLRISETDVYFPVNRP